jgi:hypothetical protein
MTLEEENAALEAELERAFETLKRACAAAAAVTPALMLTVPLQ